MAIAHCRPEVRVFGMSVHIVEPGYHATTLLHIPTLQRYNKEAWERLSPNLKEEYPEDYLNKCRPHVWLESFTINSEFSMYKAYSLRYTNDNP